MNTKYFLMVAAFSFIFTSGAKAQESEKAQSSGFYFDKENINSIKEIDLHNKDIKIFPMEIFEMKNLQILDISNNSLDELPQEIKNLENLQILKLNGNNLYQLPAEVESLKFLKEIYLDRFIWSYRLDEVRKITNARIILVD